MQELIPFNHSTLFARPIAGFFAVKVLALIALQLGYRLAAAANMMQHLAALVAGILIIMSGESVYGAPLKSAAAARLGGTKQQTPVTPFLQGVFAFWLKHGVDKQHGGFHGALDRQGKPIAPTTKSLVQQARHLWTFSTLLMAQPETKGFSTSDVRAAAQSAYNFLRSNMVKNVANGKLFVFDVARDGKVTNGGANVYANAFAIYGLSAYARATGSTEARDLALSTFNTLDNLYHSPFGGYDESSAAVVLDSIPLNPSSSSNSKVVTEGGPKAQPKLSQSFNTLLHVAEALTELSKAVGGSNPTVTTRLLEVTQLLTGPMVVRPGKAGPNTPAAYIAPNYDPRNWQPVGPPYVDYGHNIELAWLLTDAVDELEARGAVDKSQASKMRSVLQEIGEAVTAAGYDSKNGGMFEGSTIGASTPTRPNKVWWTQAEALLGFDLLARRTGNKAYKDKLQQTLEFVRAHLWDQQYGEWYWWVGAAGGAPLPYNTADIDFDGTVKGNPWKSSYHTGRAVLRLVQAGY